MAFFFRKEAVSKEKPPFSRQLILTVFNGGERLLTKAFEVGPVVIGRQPGCDLILEFPFISRTHCQVIEEAGNFLIVDLGSRNGLIINNRRTERYALSDGVAFGLEQLKVEVKLLPLTGVSTALSTQESIETVIAHRPSGLRNKG